VPTVLVTGAFGNVGSSTLRHLLVAGHRVVAVDLKSARTAKVAASFGLRIRVCWGDIRDPALWEDALGGVDAVIHLAAMMPPATERVPEAARAVNVVATTNLIRAMQGSSTARRLVFASSMGVAGCEQYRRTPPLRADEVPQPMDVYGRTKVECEQAIQASGLRWTILRLAACPPTGLSLKDAGGFELIFETSANGRIEIVHPDDAGLAFANAASCNEAIGRILMIGGGERCRTQVLAFYDRIFTTMGLRPLDPRVLRPGPEHFFGDWVDTQESQRLLQFQRHGIDDLLAELRTSLGPGRWVLKACALLASRVIARRSPHFPNR
jgi:nucleoside-diphosphate-sugar epimerase